MKEKLENLIKSVKSLGSGVKLFGLGLLTALYVNAKPVDAATYNVGPGQQFPTIQSAVDSAWVNPGSDTLLIHPDTYNENVFIDSGGGKLYMIGIGTLPDSVTIDGMEASSTISSNNDSLTYIENLKITDGSINGVVASYSPVTLKNCKVTNNYPVNIHGTGASLTLEDCVITAGRDGGISIGRSGLTIRGGEVANNGWSVNHRAIGCGFRSSLVMEDVHVHNNSGTGIYAGQLVIATIENCVVNNNYTGITAYKASPQIIGTEVRNNGNVGIFVRENFGNLNQERIEGCIVENNDVGIQVLSNPRIIMNYNDVINNRIGFHIINESDVGEFQSNCIDGNWSRGILYETCYHTLSAQRNSYGGDGEPYYPPYVFGTGDTLESTNLILYAPVGPICNVGVEEESLEKRVNPTNFTLSQNYPNPFNQSTEINYSLPQTSNINLQVYNINGSLVRTLFNGDQEAGNYSISWDGTDYTGNTTSTGIYFLRLDTDNTTSTRKMIFLSD